MREAPKGRFKKLTAMLLALTVAVGMVPIAVGTVSADEETEAYNQPSGQDLTVELYSLGADGVEYDYQPDHWVSGSVHVKVNGVLGNKAVKVSYKKKNDDDDKWIDLNSTSEPIVEEIVEPVTDEPATEPQTASSEENDNTESNTEPETSAPVTDPEPAQQKYQFSTDFYVGAQGECYDGSYDFRYEYEDGSKHTYEGFFAVKIDNVFDKLEVKTSDDTAKWKDKVTFEGTVEDKGSGLDKLTFIYGEKEKNITPDTNGTFTFEFKEDYQGDISFLALDKAGNSMEMSANIKVDSTAPKISKLEVTPDGWSNKDVTVNVEATDALSGVQKVCYIVEKDGVELSEKNAKEAEKNDDGGFTFVLTKDSIEGSTGSAIVFAVDNAGNSSFNDTNKYSVSVNIDTEECIITELSATPDTWTSGKAEIKGKITDNSSGVNADEVKYRLYTDANNKGAFQQVKDVKVDKKTKNADFSIVLNDDGKMDTGIYYVEVIAKDNAGNGSTMDESVVPSTYPLTIKIQNSAPEMEKNNVNVVYNTAPAEGTKYTKDDVIISGTVKDAFSGMDKNGGVFLKKKSDDDKKWTKAELKTNGDSVEFKYTVSESCSESYLIKAVNNVGKETIIETDEIFVDKDKPSFGKDSIVIPEGWYAATKAALVKGAVRDDGGSGIDKVYYRLNQKSGWTEIPAVSQDETDKTMYNFSMEINAEHNDFVEFMCTDKAGNQTELKSTKKLTIDTTAPVLDDIETEYNNKEWTNGDIAFVIKASDKNGTVKSGIKMVYGVLVDEDNQEVAKREAVKNEDGTFTLTVKSADFKKDAKDETKKGGFKGEVRIVALDNADNLSAASINKILIDTEKGVASNVQYSKGWTNEEMPVTLQYIDEMPFASGLKSVECFDKNNNKVSINYGVDEKTNKITVRMPKANYSGIYQLKLTDNAGNVTDDDSLKIEVQQDIEKPVISEIKASKSNQWTNKIITVSGTAKDNKVDGFCSGVESVWYKKADVENAEWTRVNSFTAINEEEAKFSFELPDELFNGKYEIRCLDKAGNESETVKTDELKYDHDAPEIVSLETTLPEGWSTGEIVVKGKIKEKGSGISDKQVFFRQKGQGYDVSIGDVTYDAEEKVFCFEKTIEPQSFAGELTFYCTDNAGNNSEQKSVSVKMDNKPPVIEVEHTKSVIESLIDHITFYFFNFQETDEANNNLTYTIKLTDDYSGLNLSTLKMFFNDKNGNKIVLPISDGMKSEHIKAVKIDTENAKICKITGSPLQATVTLTVARNMVGDISFEVMDSASTDNKGSYSNSKEMMVVDSVSPELKVNYSDPKCIVPKEGENESQENENKTYYYDNDSVELTFRMKEDNFYPEDINAKQEDTEGDKPKSPEGCELAVSKDGGDYVAVGDVTWQKIESTSNEYKAILKFSEEGSYKVRMNYTDRSLNKMEKEYTSPEIVIDRTAPKIEVTYGNTDDNTDEKVTKDGRTYYNKPREAEISITERNFNAEAANVAVKKWLYTLDPTDSDHKNESDLNPELEWNNVGEDVYTATVNFNDDANYDFSVSYTDYVGKTADYEKNFAVDSQAPELVSAEYENPIATAILKAITFGYYNAQQKVKLTFFDAVSGVQTFSCKGSKTADSSEVNKEFEINNVELTSQNGVAKAEFNIPEVDPKKANFNGVITVNVTDYVGNELSNINPFTIGDKDKKTEYGFIVDTINPNCSVELNKPVTDRSYNGTDYYDGPITGTVYINEANFNQEFLDPNHLDFQIMQSEPDVKNFKGSFGQGWSFNSEKDTATNTFTLVSEGRYAYSLSYKDPSQNVAEVVKKENLVIDTKAPTGSVSVTPEKRARDGVKYYDGDIVLMMEITEHNFDEKDVVFIADGKKIDLKWSSSGDKRTASYTFEQEGVHSYSLDYTDLAKHTMKTISDENLVIDLHNPVLKIDYSFNSDEGNSYNGRQYLDHTATAVVTVEEHNFCEEDTHIIVDRKNAAGVGDTVDNTVIFGEWQHNGDTHTRTITFADDYNYTVNATCLDMARRSINPYEPVLFTVDTVKPSDIQFTFSEPVTPEMSIGGTSYRFYNNQVKVDISSYDETSGVHRFDYHGIVAQGVSSVNQEVIKTAIEEADITQNGTTFTATFYIPKSVLDNANQFNGTVTVEAEDRSGNTVETANATRLVTDNIRPTGRITRSSEVQIAENKYFYNNDVTLTIEINEANFYPEDVDFKVDNASQTLSFSDNGDTHTATYTISSEGEHTYSLAYKDRSNNEIELLDSSAPLTNDRVLVIDKTKPVITIEKTVKNNSANKDETISFILSVTDKNFNNNGVTPVLKSTRVIKEQSADEELNPREYVSHLKEETIPMVEPVRSGDTIVYTIDNLEIDGFYRFTCTAKDYAGNTQTKIQCTGSNDKNEEVEDFDFSVNRNGSAFWVDYKGVVLDGYTNSNDIAVTLHEVNVDKIVDGYKLKIVNNDDTNEIVLNDTNYTGNAPTENGGSKNNGWFESTYTLDNKYFEKDSKYTVTLTTRDKAGNVNISSESEFAIASFTVDRTAPIISSNISKDQIIKSNGFDVEANIVENNLDPKTISAVVDGKPVEHNLEGKLVKFHLDNGTHEVRILASDLAENKSEDYIVSNVTISDNPIVLWFANKPLFFGTTGGALAIIGLVVFLLVRKRMKG